MTLGNKYFTEKGETFNHYIAKMICYKILRDRGHDCYIEFPLGEHGIADVFDFTTGLVYEFETDLKRINQKDKTSRYCQYCGVKDVIFFDLKEFTRDPQFNKFLIMRRIG